MTTCSSGKQRRQQGNGGIIAGRLASLARTPPPYSLDLVRLVTGRLSCSFGSHAHLYNMHLCVRMLSAAS